MVATVEKTLSPDKTERVITADGGSHGVRNRLWKKKLQELANEEQLTITVAHAPPAPSKWKKIEHRLFSFLSINWRAKPLMSLDVVLDPSRRRLRKRDEPSPHRKTAILILLG
jgi:hypothetical protein